MPNVALVAVSLTATLLSARCASLLDPAGLAGWILVAVAAALLFRGPVPHQFKEDPCDP